MTVHRMSMTTVTALMAKRIEKGNNVVYNIKHGAFVDNKVPYSFGVETTLVSKNFTEPLEELKGNNYITKSITRNRKLLADKNGNLMYFITKDDRLDHINDRMIFLEPPTREQGILDIRGQCVILGYGYVKNIFNELLEMPVIVTQGKVIITWKTKDDSKSVIITDDEIKFIK